MTAIPCQFWEVQIGDVFTHNGTKYRKTGVISFDTCSGAYCAWRLSQHQIVHMASTAWKKVGAGLTSFRRLRPYSTFLIDQSWCRLNDDAGMFGRFYTTRRSTDPAAYWGWGDGQCTLAPDTVVLNVPRVSVDGKCPCSQCCGAGWYIEMRPAAANYYVVTPCSQCRTFGAVEAACVSARRCGLQVVEHATFGRIQDEALPAFMRSRKTFAIRVTVTHYDDYKDPYQTTISRFIAAMNSAKCEVKYESLGPVIDVAPDKPAPPRERAIQLD